MANRGFEPEQIERIIRAFLECGGNYTYTADKAGVGYNAVLKYVRRWQSGQVVIEGLPPVAMAAAKGENATELPALKAVRAANVSLRKERDELLKEIEKLRKVADLSDMTRKHSSSPPDWTVRQGGGGGKRAIATAFLSDVHLDEVIDPAQVNWVNAYNREIATERLRLYCEYAI